MSDQMLKEVIQILGLGLDRLLGRLHKICDVLMLQYSLSG
jgi:hypothetical protein